MQEEMFLDQDFPPEAWPHDPSLPPPHSWRRFAELWPRERLPPAPAAISEEDAIVQGALGDCYLLAPLISLARRHPERVRRLFHHCNLNEVRRGQVTLCFYVHGTWRNVTIDTLLPCDADGEPIFCSGHGWAALVEKACAKLSGSFAALDGGRSVEALVELTGGVAQQVRTRAAREVGGDGEDEGGGELLIADMRKWLQQGHLVCCVRAAEQPPLNASAVAPARGSTRLAGVHLTLSNHSSNPQPRHAQSVQQVVTQRGTTLIKLVDPKDPTRELLVPAAEFGAAFERVVVCFTLGDEKPKPALRPLASRQLPSSSAAELPPSPPTQWLQYKAYVPQQAMRGGATHDVRWCDNPQWTLRCPRRAVVLVAFAQSSFTEQLAAGDPMQPHSGSCSSGNTGATSSDRQVSMFPPFCGAELLSLSAVCPPDEPPARASRPPSRPPSAHGRPRSETGGGSARAWSAADGLHAAVGPQRVREVSLRFVAAAGVMRTHPRPNPSIRPPLHHLLLLSHLSRS